MYNLLMQGYMRGTVVIMLWFLFQISFCGGINPSRVICRGREKRALLLSFKINVTDVSNRLSSWAGDECCKWRGIVCDNITGHVVMLNLGYSDDLGVVDHKLYGAISNSLLDLKHLRYLDLSGNYFGGSQFPPFFASLVKLRYLDLSNAGFAGQVPPQLGNLSNLHHLDIKGNRLTVEDLEWVRNLTSLQVLDMSGVTVRKAANWLEVMNNLHSLSLLHLSGCGLENIVPLPRVNFSSLLSLDLSRNHFISSSRFNWFSSLNSLVTLNLSFNNIHGPIPVGLRNTTSLVLLDLSHNGFSSFVPDWLCMSSLRKINLSSNEFHGRLPSNIGNLTSVENLDLSSNSFKGPIPVSLGELPSLRFLDISKNLFKDVVSEKHLTNLKYLEELIGFSNSLTLHVSSNWTPPFQLTSIQFSSCLIGPQFPAWLQTQKNLQILDMSNTGISDVIPTWFWMLPHIDFIDLSRNQIRGNLPKSLPSSSRINLGSNRLSGPLPQVSPTMLELSLSNNSFQGSLSPTLCRRIDGEYSLTYLDLSGNLLVGEIPDCWSYWTKLLVLNLGNNNLTGNIPSSMVNLTSLGSLHLRNNQLSGVLSPSLQSCKNLVVLDLSENQFTGSLPRWIGGKYLTGDTNVRLRILSLRSNKFDGNIPPEFCHLESLQILDLADNNISGSIPRCFDNLLAMAHPSHENPFFHHEYWTTEFKEAMVIVIRGREFLCELNVFPLVVDMDLSCNNLSGNIPEELTRLHGLSFLNLSNNHLEGNIPHGIGYLQNLEALDISSNKLSGVIPQSMRNMSFLGLLNLSFNDLSGGIPCGGNLLTFTSDSYTGNHKLCGYPLPKSCAEDNASERARTANEEDYNACGRDDVQIQNNMETMNHNDHEGKDGWIDMGWFCLGMPFGYIVGFWAVLGPLAFNRSWSMRFLGS